MKINFNKEGSSLNVALVGRLDTVTAPAFENFFCTNCAGITALAIDCKDLAYVSSAGLRVLLAAHKKMRGAMKLTNVCELVMEVFEMTGFVDILVIE